VNPTPGPKAKSKISEFGQPIFGMVNGTSTVVDQLTIEFKFKGLYPDNSSTTPALAMRDALHSFCHIVLLIVRHVYAMQHYGTWQSSIRHYDTWQSGIRHNDTWQNGIRHYDTWLNGIRHDLEFY
jgi:hypothetical protein